MLPGDSYPYLAHLLSSYFHQDAFDHGETAEDVLSAFAGAAQPYERLGLAADIHRFLHVEGECGLLQAFERTFNPDLILARDDQGLKALFDRALVLVK